MVEDSMDPGPVPILQSNLPSLLGSKADNLPSKVLTSKMSGRLLAMAFLPHMGNMTSSYVSSDDSSMATTEIIQRPAKAKLVAMTTFPRESDLMFWQEATKVESWSHCLFSKNCLLDHSSVKSLAWLTLALPLANCGKKLISRFFGRVSHGPDYLRFYIILFIVVPHQAIVLAFHWLILKLALFKNRPSCLPTSFLQ